VLGFPCNQFGAQEPGDEKAIEQFCELNYGVTFPMFAKVDVNGDDASPLFKHLKSAKKGILGSETIKWNFTKFLVDREGQRRRALRAEDRAQGARERREDAAVTRALPRACAALAIAALALSTAAHAQPDPNKVIRAVFPTGETGFDPQAAGDIYSNAVNRVIFDTPYTYDYLARPYKLIPNTAVALPEITDGGKLWTIRIKPGIYFADDPVFKGQKRELTAYDYVYSWKRVMDPRMRSNSMQMFDGRFEGMDEVVNATKEGGKFDYDRTIAGLQAVDRYTIRMKLNFPDTELLANLTTSSASAVAREVVEAYADGSGWVMANPVGTGPTSSRNGAAASASCSRRARRSATSASPTAATRQTRRWSRSTRASGSRSPAASRSASSRRATRAARVRGRRDRLRRGAGRPRLERAGPAGDDQAAARRARHHAVARRAAGDQLHVLQHGGPDRRRLHARQGRAAPRVLARLQRRRGGPGDPAGPGVPGDAGDPADGDRP
jgi:hypothetical protein